MNWFKQIWNKRPFPELADSILYDQGTFYKKFTQDLLRAEKEVIIESPFVTSSRMEILFPIFQKLLNKGVKIHIVTKDPAEYDDEYFKHQATNEILSCADIGVNIVFIDKHHRKIAIIDRLVLWEGSLNILSQNRSLEFMRRIESETLTKELFKFLKFDKLKVSRR